jgi:hypothetical protein
MVASIVTFGRLVGVSACFFGFYRLTIEGGECFDVLLSYYAVLVEDYSKTGCIVFHNAHESQPAFLRR